VSDALGEVSMGSEESSRGIEQINQGTQEVCEVNEKNASFVDELTQETHKLKEKAQHLQEITGVFVLGSKDVFESEMEAADSDPAPASAKSKPKSKSERRRATPVNRPLRDDLVHKSAMEDLNDDLLEKEFEEGFEEF
jgi:methyl-accepting chemotaxis protein